MKKLVTLLGRFLAVLSIIFLYVKLGQHLDEIPDFTWGLPATLSLIATLALSVVSIVINAYIWALLLRGGGVFLTLRQAYIIVGQSQIGKYLPGNIFQYLGRVTLGHRVGISTEALVLSTGFETFLAVVTTTTIAVIGLFFDGSVLRGVMEELDINRSSFVVAISAFLFAIIAIVWPRARAWVRPRLAYLHAGRVGVPVFLYLTVFTLLGMSILLLLRTLWGVTTELHWYQFTWGIALAWVMGFIVPGAPGGIGIREAILVKLYGHELGEGLVIGLVLVLRVVTSLGDLFAFGLACWLDRQKELEELDGVQPKLVSK